jgi:hypothetical protein
MLGCARVPCEQQVGLHEGPGVIIVLIVGRGRQTVLHFVKVIAMRSGLT